MCSRTSRVAVDGTDPRPYAGPAAAGGYGGVAGSGNWDFQPFAGSLVVTSCESPLVKRKGDGPQQELF